MKMEDKNEKWTYCYIAGFIGVLALVVGIICGKLALARGGAGILILSGGFILLRLMQGEDERLQVAIGVLGVASLIVGIYTLITVHDKLGDSVATIIIGFVLISLTVCGVCILLFLFPLVEGDDSPTVEDRVEKLEREVISIKKILKK